MVVDKLFEFIEDIERFCVNHRWSRFFNDWETGDEALDEYAMIYKNCCNDVDEEKDAANDIFTELTEYMDCLYNYIDDDYVKLLDDEKQNARKWLDKVEKVIGSCVFSLKGNDLKGFLIKGYQMCHLIKEAAVKTPDEYYGGRRTDVMPYYIGENKNQLFNNILNEDNMGKLNEKRIELSNPYPVKKNEIIDIVERSTRLVHTATDDKTIQLYIYSKGSERPEAFAEVEITSVGYILHGAEGYDYQGSSMKEFEDDLRDVVFNFDATTSRRFGENNTIDKEKLFESLLNESSLKEYFFYATPHHEEDEEDTIIGYIAAVRDYQTQKTKYVDDDGNVCNSKSQAKVFDTKGKADNYSYDHCPEGWTHFVVALKKSDILNESDDTYKAKVNGKWLKGNKLVKDKKDADTFESKTEPTQRINQMKKDGKLNKNAKPSVIKESLTFDDTIRTRIHIESEEDLEDTPFTYYLDADIGDTVYICEDADVYMREDKNGWVIFWHNKFMEHIPLSLLDRDDEEACNAKYRQAQNRYKAICNAALDGTLEKEFLPKNGKPSFDHSNAAEVFKQFGENKINKNQLFESKEFLFDYLLEAVEDFPRNTRAMYRFAKRRHDDTGAIRKVSKQPYWVHPEGVAKIVMEHGGSDIEIKAAMAHDVLEDTGESYEDMVEKFGEKVASIVKEVTNDKDEIAKVGKEKYISEELCHLSPEALTVKLADMLYNMKDSPTEKNYERMRKNIAFLMMNRQLGGKHLELAQEIMEV